MDKITNAITLSDQATRGEVAITYGIAGLMLGVLFFGR